MAALLAGLPADVPAATVNRLCGSGLDALALAARTIVAGEAELAIAGGVESMSRAPFVLAKADSAFSRTAKIEDTTIGWRFVNPLMKARFGIDSMPETAENVAAEHAIERADQDAFALRSQSRALAAQANGTLAQEIVGVPVPQKKGEAVVVDRDEHPRATTLEALAKLKPIVRPDGSVTAGNASGVNDGSCALLVASEAAARRHGLVAAGAHRRRGDRRGRAADHGHRPGAGNAEAARAHRPAARRHRRDRAERGVRGTGACGDADAGVARRCAARQSERWCDRAGTPARRIGGPARDDRAVPARTQRRPLWRSRQCASASGRASRSPSSASEQPVRGIGTGGSRGGEMEVSFSKEVRMLRQGRGEIFHGEGILAITKALLQSGVAYVGGYQGAPVSHLMDVLVQSKDYLAELGVHVEACSNEASAAAMLGASIHYPLRGAVTWKSIVGTNVAADALSNLASPGVTGGALIVIGEDYGEGASVIQERTLAFALKSSLILLDPRPELAHMVRMVEEGFALSEAASTPVLLQLRIRACHVRGSFVCKDNVAPAMSARHLAERAGAVRLQPAVASAVDVPAGEAEVRRAPAGGAALHRRAPTERDVPRPARRPRHRRAGRPLQFAGPRAGRSSGSPTTSAASVPSLSCSTSRVRWCRTRSATSAPASARCSSSRKASRNSSSRRS